MKKYKNEQILHAVVNINVQRIKIRRVMFMKQNVLKMALALFMAASAISVYADTTTTTTNTVDETIVTVAKELGQTTKSQQPNFKNGQRPPEPPKDANGNPLPPPDKIFLNGVKNSDSTAAESQNFDFSKFGKQPPEPRNFKNGERQSDKTTQKQFWQI